MVALSSSLISTMKQLRVVLYAIGLVLTGLGATMVITNPSQPTYEKYATQRLVDYLQENICTPQLQLFGASLQQDCKQLLAENQAEIQRLVAKGTKQQNFGVLSVYRTELSAATVFPLLPSNMVPAYRFETIGIFQSFYTYKIQQQ